MKIAIDISHYNKMSWFGVVTRNLVNAVMNLDKDNIYYLITNTPINKEYLENLNKYTNCKLIVKKSNFFYYKFFGITKILKENKIDLFVSLDQQLPLIKVCKYFCISHDIQTKITPKWKLLKQFISWKIKFTDFLYPILPLEEYSYKLADKIFTPSINTKNDLEKNLWVKSDKIIATPRWIDHLKDYKSWKKENYILFPFPNNPDWFYELLTNKIIENELVDKIIILKPRWKINNTLNKKIKVINSKISDSELVELYKNAKISIYISDYDWFWFPPLESIYYWTPVIYNSHSCMEEIVWEWGIRISNLDINKFLWAIKKFNNSNYYKEQIIKWDKRIQKYKRENTAKILLNNI